MPGVFEEFRIDFLHARVARKEVAELAYVGGGVFRRRLGGVDFRREYGDDIVGQQLQPRLGHVPAVFDEQPGGGCLLFVEEIDFRHGALLREFRHEVRDVFDGAGHEFLRLGERYLGDRRLLRPVDRRLHRHDAPGRERLARPVVLRQHRRLHRLRDVLLAAVHLGDRGLEQVARRVVRRLVDARAPHRERPVRRGGDDRTDFGLLAFGLEALPGHGLRLALRHCKLRERHELFELLALLDIDSHCSAPSVSAVRRGRFGLFTRLAPQNYTRFPPTAGKGRIRRARRLP